MNNAEYLKTDDDFVKAKKAIDNIGKEFKPIASHEHAQSTSNFKLIYLLPAAVAACILLGVVLRPMFDSVGTQDHFSTYFQPSDISLLTRGAGSENIRSKAQAAFNDRKYDDASIHLSQLLQKDPSNLDIQFYLAIANIGSEKYDGAIKLLDSLEDQATYRPGANWYKALLHLKQSNTVEAIRLLNSIPAQSSYHNNAVELLEQLK